MSDLITIIILAAVVACISWTWTHEEIFKEIHDWLVKQSKEQKNFFVRKFFFALSCEYCFSHYVCAFWLWITSYQYHPRGFWGYALAWYAVVWVANVYMSAFGRLRLDIKHEKLEIAEDEKAAK